MAMEDPQINAALFRPAAPDKAQKIVSFLIENQNLITQIGGMSSVTTGLDRSKLADVAERLYRIPLRKWLFAVNWFERGLLERQASLRPQK